METDDEPPSSSSDDDESADDEKRVRGFWSDGEYSSRRASSEGRSDGGGVSQRNSEGPIENPLLQAFPEYGTSDLHTDRPEGTTRQPEKSDSRRWSH